MTSPGIQDGTKTLNSASEADAHASLRASHIEARLAELDQLSDVRRGLLRELYFTMKSQFDPSSILSIESEVEETSSQEGEKFLSEWDIDEEFTFKSITLLNADVPSPPSPGAPKGNRGSLESPSRPSKPSTTRGENEMELDTPERRVAQPTEEAMVDAMVKDEDDMEASMVVGESVENANQPEKVESEPIGQDPATPSS
ncbi:hypothetical protein M407DRAFT_32472, partial [Tulasnella calospora MUT 4182]